MSKKRTSDQHTTLGRSTRVASVRRRAIRAAATGCTSLLASLNGVDLALGELSGANALVRGAVLLEAVVLCDEESVSTAGKVWQGRSHTSGLVSVRHIDGCG